MLRHIAARVIIVVNVFFGGKLLIPFQDFKLSLVIKISISFYSAEPALVPKEVLLSSLKAPRKEFTLRDLDEVFVKSLVA